MATEHLITQGCLRIAHIRGPEVATAQERLRGYADALESNGLEYRADWVVAADRVDSGATQHGAEAMKRLLESSERPDAVFAFNDPLAIGAMHAALNAGLRIPEDMAFIGCGNLHFDDLLRVPLSSVDQQSAEIGRRTAQILLDLIETKEKPASRSVILEPHLIPRASSLRR